MGSNRNRELLKIGLLICATTIGTFSLTNTNSHYFSTIQLISLSIALTLFIEDFYTFYKKNHKILNYNIICIILICLMLAEMF